VFTEILRIKPRIDQASASSMEKSLSARFSRVAKRFGKGLSAVVKGSIVGISLGFLAKLLNPLKEVEDRIRALLGEGEDARELAEKYGTTTGKLRNLQDASSILGVRPEQFKELMEKFAQSIEKAREEIEKGEETSDATKVLTQFTDEKDMAEAFYSFLRSLREASPEVRTTAEKEIFGSRQTGSTKRLIEGDLQGTILELMQRSKGDIGKAIDKIASLSDQERAKGVFQDRSNLINTSQKINEKIIDDIARSRQRELEKEQRDLANFQSMKKTQEGIDEIAKMLEVLMDLVRNGVAYLGELIVLFKNSALFKGLGKLFGK